MTVAIGIVGLLLAFMLLVMGMAIVARDSSVLGMSAGVAAFLAVVLIAMVSLTP